MRFALGLIFGIGLTIGTAYVVDTMSVAPDPDRKEAPHMVNWDVVDARIKSLSTSIQEGWKRLVASRV